MCPWNPSFSEIDLLSIREIASIRIDCRARNSF